MNAENGSNRVNRGGGWNNNAVNCRSANRNHDAPGNRNDNLGFRLLSTRLCRRRRVHGHGARAAG
ncbi:MAG: SUMF1/EgtB/PvdO family nonheme iron enzyme [Burkholderiales bacterium]